MWSLVLLASLPAPGSLNQRVNFALTKGIDFFGKGEILEAQAQFEQAMSIAEEQGLEYEMAEVSNWLGNVYQELKELAKAKEAYEKAYTIALKYDNEVFTNRLEINLGLLETEFDRPDLALSHFRQAVSYFSSVQDSLNLLKASNGLGYALLNCYKMDSAKIQLESSLDLATHLGNSLELARVHTHLGALYNTMLRHQLASVHYEKALPYLHSIGADESAQIIYFDLLQIYLALADIGAMNNLMLRYDEHFDNILPEHQRLYYVYSKIVSEDEEGASNLLIWFVCILSVFAAFMLAIVIRMAARLRRTGKTIELPQPELPMIETAAAEGVQTLQDEQAEQVLQKARILTELSPIWNPGNPKILWTYYYRAQGENGVAISKYIKASSSSVTIYYNTIKDKLGVKQEDIPKHAMKIGLLDLSKPEFVELFKLEED